MRSISALLTILSLCISCGPKSGRSTGPDQAIGAADNTDKPLSTDSPGHSGKAGSAIGGAGIDDSAGVPLAEVGLSAEAMDRGADPCEDFYQYACGGWMENTEIPADQPYWKRSFSEIRKRNEEDLKRIFSDAVAANADDPVTAGLGAYYSACIDEEAIEKTGLSGIEPLLKKARKIKRWKQIGPVLIELHTYAIYPVFTPSMEADFERPEIHAPWLRQGGLGLPDRSYYLEEKSRPILARYAAHVEKMMTLAGMEPEGAKQAAVDVIALETELAKDSLSRVEMRDYPARWNRLDRRGLKKTFRNLDWDKYLKAVGAPKQQDIAVTSIQFFEGANRLFAKMAPKQWISYMQWTIIRFAADTLPKAFTDEAFAMRKVLTGQKVPPPRWKRCVRATDAALKEYSGRVFVALRFGADAKQAVTGMINGISGAFGNEVNANDWMDEATKKTALEKRDKMSWLIGYPEKWKDYGFALDAAKYTENWLAARQWESKREWAKAGARVDKGEHVWSAATVNAGYSTVLNTMYFPAGILQPPYYDPNANIAVNLGALGAVVGHELTHGFDDTGAKFDTNGAVRNWWSEGVAETFNAKKQCMVDQYEQFEALPGAKVNGELTLGENIADLGGVKMAFRAYRTMREGQEPVIAEGLDEDQQFFLSFGQSWCTKQTDEMTRLMLQVDVHSPAKLRVNGSLMNLPEFADTFSCAKGAPMNPEMTCTVW